MQLTPVYHVDRFFYGHFRIGVSSPTIAFIQNLEDLEKAISEKKIGAILSLEGVEGLMGSLRNLRIAYFLGVRCIGITWNYANWLPMVLWKREMEDFQ